MNKKITEALDFIKNLGLQGVVIAIPFSVGVKDILELRAHPLCKGLVLRNPSPDITANSTSKWLGCYENHGWRLPTVRAPIVFIGSQLMLTRQMATQVLKSRRFFVICKVNGVYQQLSMLRFLIWSAGEKLVRTISKQPESHPLRKAVRITKQVPLLRMLWRRIFKREDLSSDRLSKGRQNENGLSDDALYKALMQRAQKSAQSIRYNAVPGRVLLVNAGLAAGGAERQIVNTLVGLKASEQCESVGLLAEYIDHAPNLDFFLHELEAAGIEVSQVEHNVSLNEDGLSCLEPEVAELIADIEPGLIEEILNLVEAFRARRPEVVHAWQDSSSIKAGIAAVIVGVPRIVLASRNVTPINFTYYQDYMQPAYRGLASLECVRFLNNSEAGAADYTQWLGLPRERFCVVRNGVDLGYLSRVDSNVISEYKQSHGIPENAQVIGSIFRFWAEKRPMLWLEMAAFVANRYPTVHFLIIGEGPMRKEMEAFIDNNGLKERFHLPGARPEVAVPLSAMNIFVLTSEFEGTPNVVLEAQWLGLPIVATDAGGAREAFKQGETGFLATTATAESIGSLVCQCLTAQTMHVEAATKGPAFIESEFGVSRMIQETIMLYGFPMKEPIVTPQAASKHVKFAQT